jgi:hypothetical protein
MPRTGARWLIGAYGECSTACGGTQTRQVTCVNSANVTVLAGYCTAFAVQILLCDAHTSSIR